MCRIMMTSKITLVGLLSLGLAACTSEANPPAPAAPADAPVAAPADAPVAAPADAPADAAAAVAMTTTALELAKVP